MADVTTMTYGGYNIKPVPLVQIQRQNAQVGNRKEHLGYTFTMTLNGTITPYPADGGLIVTDGLIEEIRQAFNRDGKLLEIKCGLTTVMQIYPRIKGISFNESNNNWVNTVPYTIELEYDEDYDTDPENPTDIPPFIEDYTEEWSCEFITDKKYFVWDLSTVVDQQAGYDYASVDSNNPWEARVTHTITAKGKQSWTGPGATGTCVDAVDNAMSFLTGVWNDAGYDHYNWGAGLCGWNNLISHSGDGEAFDHYRTHTVNETDGTVTLTESWLVLGRNSGLAPRRISEDFTVEVRESIENGLVNISIQGTIQGVEERDYGTTCDLETPVTKSAYKNAEDAWAVIQDRVFPRAQLIYEQEFARILNPKATTKSVGHNPSRGTITYSLEFNDRPCAFITGALSENFTIVDNNPSDVFAKLPVLGRAAGPVLQEISTVTEAIREVTIEAVMNPPTGCSSITDLDLNKPTNNVENLLCDFETQLTSAYDQVFKNSDTENWNPLSGRYSRTVSWTYQSCTGTPSTTLCD